MATESYRERQWNLVDPNSMTIHEFLEFQTEESWHRIADEYECDRHS